MQASFIGRDRELAELLAGLDSTFRGQGSVFLITGEPGIGKTALIEQLAMRAAERSARVVWSRSWEGGGAAPYWLWAQVVRALVAELDDSAVRDLVSPGLAHVAQLVPELRDRVGEARRAISGPNSDAGRFYLFESTASLLRQLSARQPLVLLLDDVLDADHPSLLLLRFLARDVRASRILVVATCRDADTARSAEAVDVLADMIRDGVLIRLCGLDRDGIDRLIADVAGVAPWKHKAAEIQRATGGNPLFAREVTRLVAAEDPLDRPGRLSIPVPDSVRAVIRRRLAFLSADSIQILSAAAVVGHDFDLALVAAACDLPNERVLAALADAVTRGIATEVADSTGAYRFSHPLMREAIYEGLPLGARTQMHHRVATAIERLHGPDSSAHLGELAYHFAKVAAIGEAAKAGDYARRAGDQALDSSAYEDAVVQYRRALHALALSGQPDPGLRCELLLCLCRAQARAGDYQSSKATALQAAEIARTLPAPELLAQAALSFGEPQVEGGLVDRELVALLQESIERLHEGDSVLRSRVVARLSLELTFSDDPTLRETLRPSLSLEAIEMARRLGDAVALCNALRARWLALWGPDGLEERTALAEEHLALAQETGDREIELLARARRITCRIEAGDGPTAAVDIAAHEQLAATLRMPYHEWAAASMQAGRALLAGSFDRVETLAQGALDRLPGRPNAYHAHLNQTTVVRWEQGRLGELHGTWHDLVERFPQLAFASGWRCLADIEVGLDAAARHGLRELVHEIPALPRNGLLLPALALAALAAAELEDADAAAVILPLLEPHADLAVVISMPHPVVCFGSASLYLGLLATVIGAWDDAERHFEVALRRNERLGARAFLARTQCEYGHMLIRRGRPGDQGRACHLLDRAATLAGIVGSSRTGNRVARLLRLASDDAAGGDAAVAATVPADTSTRVPPLVAVPVPAGEHVFSLQGEYWTIAYDGAVVRLRDSKGLRYLARLLGNPGRELLAVDLEAAEASAAAAPGASAGGSEPRSQFEPGDAGAMLDAPAKAAYKERIDDLRAEIEEAESFNDPDRAGRARDELEFVARELARAVGLGGRDRRAGSQAERARLNVTRAIRAAQRILTREHPALGHHLSLTIRTGRYCAYTPDPRVPIRWQS